MKVQGCKNLCFTLCGCLLSPFQINNVCNERNTPTKVVLFLLYCVTPYSPLLLATRTSRETNLNMN